MAFHSRASNLVPGDTNNNIDVFVRDRKLNITERVSLGQGGIQLNGQSASPAISANGRFVAFRSMATNVVPSDTSDHDDVFVHDRLTGATEWISMAQDGGEADSSSDISAISADGRFVVFDSFATNLVSGDTNDANDIFMRDRRTGTTRRVSGGSHGTQGNGSSSYPLAISADARFVAFLSDASNLVPGDTNDTSDVFVHDCKTDITERVSVGRNGVQANDFSSDVSISADGRFVAFTSFASNLVPGDTNEDVDVFVRDRQTGTTERISLGPRDIQGNAQSAFAAISGDGRFVAFGSFATNLVTGDTNRRHDIFLRDRENRTTRLVSAGLDGAPANSFSGDPSITMHGGFVSFWSYASNLVPSDTNRNSDLFISKWKP